MVARLAESGRRLKRRLAPGRTPDPPLVQPVDPNPAPRPPTGFFTQAPQQRDRVLQLEIALEFTGPAAVLPLDENEAKHGGMRHAPAQPLSGLVLRDIGFAPHVIATTAAVSLSPVLPAAHDRRGAGVLGVTGKLFRMRPRSGIDCSLPVRREGAELVEPPATAKPPRLHLRVIGFAIPDPILRPQRISIAARERVLSAQWVIPASPGQFRAQPAIQPRRHLPAAPAPAFVNRAALSTGPAGVAQKLAPWWVADLAAVACEPVASAPMLARTQGELQPRLSERLFRARPRAGVGDVPALGLIGTSNGEQIPEVALPAATLWLNLPGPHRTDRLFRMRPRAGAHGHTAEFIAAGIAFAAGSGRAAALPRPLGSVIGIVGEPPMLERSLRMRPRNPVGSASVAPLFPLEPAPAPSAITRGTPWSQVELRPVLKLVSREYRMRPRGPIGTAAPTPLPVPCGGPSAAIRPSFASSRVEFSPAPRPATREYRMRPRGPVGGPPPLSQTIQPAAFGARIRTATPQISAAGPLTLKIVDRLYRMRPRTAINSRRQAAPPAPQALRVEIRLLAPRNHLRGGIPQESTRLFRMRPRNPVACASASLLRLMQTGAAEASEIFVMPPVPQMRVVRTFELPRAERPNRIPPPGPTAATGDNSSVAGPEPLDPALVARSSLQVRFPTITAVIRLVEPETKSERFARITRSLLATYFNLQCWRPAAALRLSSCGAAVLFVILVYTASKSSASSAHDSGRPDAVAGTVSDFRKSLAARAAVDLNETFASGLHEWQGGPEWAASWTYDDRGGIRPGALALYKPSVGLRDYTFEFIGQIEQKALTFVTRAADIENYYVIKLVVTQPGPLPEVSIVRYPVIGGSEGQRVRKRLVMTVYNDTIYRVKTALNGDTWALSVNDRVVDSWTDERLATGGVGLFCGKGEKARMYDLRIRHQDDTIGKVLATITPTTSEATKGNPGK